MDRALLVSSHGLVLVGLLDRNGQALSFGLFAPSTARIAGSDGALGCAICRSVGRSRSPLILVPRLDVCLALVFLAEVDHIVPSASEDRDRFGDCPEPGVLSASVTMPGWT